MWECPLCAVSDADDEYLFLFDHVWFRHIKGVECWCGADFGFGGDGFADHIKAEGGLLAHFLACQLGPSNNES